MTARMSRKESASSSSRRSLFDLPSDFFDSCRLLSDPSEIPSTIQGSTVSSPSSETDSNSSSESSVDDGGEDEDDLKAKRDISGWSCNTCKVEFVSLQDQRSHFKSDFHRANVKLSLAGKHTIHEEDFDKLGGEFLFEDDNLSSASGSGDEFEKGPFPKAREGARQKLYLRLRSGETVSVWRCLLLDETEDLSFENITSNPKEIGGCMSCVGEDELVKRLKYLVHEPRNKTHLRIVLLASGGRFAGCVFDGKTLIAKKTFNRYVDRRKAGKKQSTKDASGKVAHSAGSTLRRYNEARLKQEIQELLVTWKPHFDASSCIFFNAPSKNRQLLFDGEKPQLHRQERAIRHIPLTVHKATLKEADRIYQNLTYMACEVNDEGCPPKLENSILCAVDEGKSNQESNKEVLDKKLEIEGITSAACSGLSSLDSSMPDKGEVIDRLPVVKEGTLLHEAAKSGDAQRTLELLEQGLDPCVKDARGRTPYMLAAEKEVRNTFRRFMALNLDRWDWHAANVPSPLTQEMEASQAEKQAEKDAKRKAKAKELKKLRKAKEKAQSQRAASENASSTVCKVQETLPVAAVKRQTLSSGGTLISKEEEQKRALAEERERRAAAAERRIAALSGCETSTAVSPNSLEPKSGAGDILCSCCNASLAGKVPFHRYHYKYCSTSCMHVHREMLEDG